MNLFAIVSLAMTHADEGLLTGLFGLFLLLLAAGIRRVETSESRSTEEAHSQPANLDVALGMVAEPPAPHQVTAHLHPRNESATLTPFI